MSEELEHPTPLDPVDQQELKRLQARLQEVQTKISQLEQGSRDPYLDDLSKHFHLGRVGGSGHGTHRLNARRDRSLDKTIDTAIKLTPLYREATRLEAAISEITSGARKRKRERESKRQAFLLEAQGRVRQTKKGDYVFDQTYGRVEVLARNQKSLSIRTPGGRREARKFEWIIDVDYRTKDAFSCGED
jgi:hypothetical protein